jgi:hypothetical protein
LLRQTRLSIGQVAERLGYETRITGKPDSVSVSSGGIERVKQGRPGLQNRRYRYIGKGNRQSQLAAFLEPPGGRLKEPKLTHFLTHTHFYR